jgi:formylglycine-generating enzyme required for sulfatase activity
MTDSGAVFKCIAWNSADSATSNPAVLTVNRSLSLPVINTHPSDTSVAVGKTASFSVSATGTGLQYQWQKNSIDISGATLSSYTTPATLLTDSGAVFRCVVRNTGGPVTSNPAILTVINVPAGMKLVPAKGNAFSMGGNTGESDEQPVHTINFTYDFTVDTVEVTQEAYSTIMSPAYAGYFNPTWTAGNGNTYPAYNITWHDAVLYCNARTRSIGSLDTVYTYTSISGTPGNGSSLNGLSINMSASGYRLPTEAEWEFACGNNAYKYHWGDDSASAGTYSQYAANSGSSTRQVAQKSSNAYGLYDMSGNVREWCNDWYAAYGSGTETDPAGPGFGTSRVNRGGSWDVGAYYIRTAIRYSYPPGNRNSNLGFRVCRPVR